MNVINWLKNNIYFYFFLLLFSMILGRMPLLVLTISGTLVSLCILVKYKKKIIIELCENRYLYVSLAFFIPICISIIDTLHWVKSFSVFSKMILYVFIGVIALLMNANNTNFKRLHTITFFGIIFICVDAICQWQFNHNIYGYNPPKINRVSGIFKDSYHLSYFLGTFTPVILFYLYSKIKEKMTMFRIVGAVLAMLLFIIAVVIGGARAGFISMVVSMILFVIYLFYKKEIKHPLRFVVAGLFIVFISALVLSQSKLVQNRFLSTLSGIGTDHFFERFSSSRTNIWYVAVKEIPNYWINGVGPRAFNVLYQTYPESYKIFDYVMQPHLHGLEVLIETGIIGFIPYIIVCLYLLIRMFTAQNGNMWIMMGFIAMMPINSHVGLYEGFWMPMIWVPIMLGFAQTRSFNI